MASEGVVYIDSVLFAGAAAVSADSTTERSPLRPQEVWIDIDAIPAVPPPRTAWPGTVGAYTAGVLDEPLAPATPDGLAWTTTPASRLNLVLTAAVQNGAYAPSIRDGAGKVLPYQSATWYVDGVKNVVVFRRSPPAALGLTPPLTLSYWYYTGAISGTSLAVIGGFNVGSAPGELLETITGGQMRFRTLAADTAPGREGLEVTTVGSQVRLGSTLTGANLGSGEPVFSGRNGSALEFRSVGTLPNTGINVVSNTDRILIAIANSDPFNINAGAGSSQTRIGTDGTTGTITVGSTDVTALDLTAAMASLNAAAGTSVTRIGTGGTTGTITVGSTDVTAVDLTAAVASLNAGAGTSVTRIGTGGTTGAITVGSSGVTALDLTAAVASLNAGAGPSVTRIGTGGTTGAIAVGSTDVTALDLTAAVASLNAGAGSSQTRIGTDGTTGAITIGSGFTSVLDLFGTVTRINEGAGAAETRIGTGTTTGAITVGSGFASALDLTAAVSSLNAGAGSSQTRIGTGGTTGAITVGSTDVTALDLTAAVASLNAGAGASVTRIGTGGTTGAVSIGGGAGAQEVGLRGGAVGGAVRINTEAGSTAATTFGGGAGTGTVSITGGTPVANIVTGITAGGGIAVGLPTLAGSISVTLKKAMWRILQTVVAGTAANVGRLPGSAAANPAMPNVILVLAGWNRRYLNFIETMFDPTGLYGGNLVLTPGTQGAVVTVPTTPSAPSSFMTLQPGKYYVTARAPITRSSGTILHKIILVNTTVPTSPVVLLTGSTEYVGTGITTSWSELEGAFDVTVANTKLELLHFISAASGSLGLAASATALTSSILGPGANLPASPAEVYTQLIFTLLD